MPIQVHQAEGKELLKRFTLPGVSINPPRVSSRGLSKKFTKTLHGRKRLVVTRDSRVDLSSSAQLKPSRVECPQARSGGRLLGYDLGTDKVC